MKRVYLDNAATTPMAPEVLDAMLPYMKEEFGNPSSSHYYGRKTKAGIEMARRNVAQHLNCSPSEIVFTSGGTEADNMALFCAVNDLKVEQIITSPIEHHAVLHTADFINNFPHVKVHEVKVDQCGRVNLEHLESLLKNGVKTMVSLMHANNEIGTLLPIKKVSELCRNYGAYFHSDTVQTMGHYAFDLNDLDIDFITCAAHKFHGPKGVGFLYVNKNIKGQPLIHGGAQERGMRGGTENLYGIIGLSKAMDLAYEDLQSHQKHVQGLKDFMIEALKKQIPGVDFHGCTAPEESLYTVLNVCFPPSDKGGLLLFTLDLKGIAASGGSACSSGASTGSHVLKGIGADGSRPNTRFSFSRYTKKEEIDYCLEQLEEIFEVCIPVKS